MATTRIRDRLPHGRAADAALAVAVFVLIGAGSLRTVLGPRVESWWSTALSWALIAVSCGALYWWRRYPLPVALVTMAASMGYYLLSVYDGPVLAVFVFALYGVAASGRMQAAVAIAALSLVGVGVGTLLGNDDVNGVALFMLAGWLVGVVALGWARHSRIAFAAETERRAAYEERLRIARELHDAVGHHLSLINVQAAAAQRRIAKSPGDTGSLEQAATALGAIRETSKEALRELRVTLGVLRQADEAAPTAPPRGLADLPELAAAARAAGLVVELGERDERPAADGGDRADGRNADGRNADGGDERRHEPDAGSATAAVPPEVGKAAYRIVQEALTNVARHAGASRAEVLLRRGAGSLVVEVADDGRGPTAGAAAPRAGHGITGMRERARALGGTLTTGQGPAGGFLVRAELPCGDADRGTRALGETT